MSYLRSKLHLGGKACDKCGKPMDDANPGIELIACHSNNVRQTEA
jgi:hypothetical protein